MTLTLEVIEGPAAGHAATLERALVVGRDSEADVRLGDRQASRRHARIVPTEHGALVEDLGSTNGTFVNAQQVHGATAVAAGDDLVIGVTVLRLRTSEEVARQPTAARAIPPGLAVPERRPTYLTAADGADREVAGVPELERLRDRRTKAQASLAPLPILVLVALAVIVYLGLT